MSEIIFNKVKRRRLLESRDSHAQPIIDYLNAVRFDCISPLLFDMLNHEFFQCGFSAIVASEFLGVGGTGTSKAHSYCFTETLRKIHALSNLLYPWWYRGYFAQRCGRILRYLPRALSGTKFMLKSGAVIREAGSTWDVEGWRILFLLWHCLTLSCSCQAHSREAILWSQLEHPNIAPFYGVFCLKEAHGRICLLSPLMENGNIVEYLKKESQVPRRPFVSLHHVTSIITYKTFSSFMTLLVALSTFITKISSMVTSKG